MQEKDLLLKIRINLIPQNIDWLQELLIKD